jgi:hypothetical protein
MSSDSTTCVYVTRWLSENDVSVHVIEAALSSDEFLHADMRNQAAAFHVVELLTRGRYGLPTSSANLRSLVARVLVEIILEHYDQPSIAGKACLPLGVILRCTPAAGIPICTSTWKILLHLLYMSATSRPAHLRLQAAHVFLLSAFTVHAPTVLVPGRVVSVLAAGIQYHPQLPFLRIVLQLVMTLHLFAEFVEPLAGVVSTLTRVLAPHLADPYVAYCLATLSPLHLLADVAADACVV